MNTNVKLIDEDDTLGLGCVTLELSIDYVVHPGDPGCRHTANGDGWPPTPPEVDVINWSICRVVSFDGREVFGSERLLSQLKVWVSERIDSDRETIESELLSFAEDRP